MTPKEIFGYCLVFVMASLVAAIIYIVFNLIRAHRAERAKMGTFRIVQIDGGYFPQVYQEWAAENHWMFIRNDGRDTIHKEGALSLLVHKYRCDSEKEAGEVINTYARVFQSAPTIIWSQRTEA